MKTNILLLNIVILLNLLGCQNTQQSTATPAGNPTTLQTVDGPSDGGGGDTCNGKMIESYKIDILQLPEVKTYLNSLNGNTISIDGKVSFLTVMSTYKNWYLIDCALEQIPQERKGLYLQTEQTAVHTGKEVFIDANLYKKMHPEEKAKLILHEVIMGVYLMKYMTVQEVCSMSSDCNMSSFDAIKNWKHLEPEIYKPLDEADHQRIRNVTIWAWDNKDNTVAFPHFRNILATNNFDRRFTQPITSALSDKIEIYISDIERMFKRHEWTKSYPEFCQFNKKDLVSQSSCNISVKTTVQQPSSALNDRNLAVELKIMRKSDQKILQAKFTVRFDKNGKTSFDTHKDSIIPFNYFILSAGANYPMMFEHDSIQEGHKTQFIMMSVRLDQDNELNLIRLDYNTQVWYSVSTEIITQVDGKKKKVTTGYHSNLDEESETVYFENSLPYLFSFGNPKLTILKESYVP